jgi:putative transposase
MKLTRRAYPTDLTETQWKIIRPFLPVEQKRGRPSQDLREVINGVLYIFKSGQDWRMMPHDLPPWQTVYAYYQRWLKNGTWEEINAQLQLRVIAQQPKNESLVVAWISNRLKQVKEA